MPPIYDFICTKCGKVTEYICESSIVAIACPECNYMSGRMLSAPHVGNQFRKAWDRAPPNPQRNDGPRRKARVDK